MTHVKWLCKNVSLLGNLYPPKHGLKVMVDSECYISHWNGQVNMFGLKIITLDNFKKT